MAVFVVERDSNQSNPDLSSQEILHQPDLQVVLRHEANLPALLRVIYLREGKRICNPFGPRASEHVLHCASSLSLSIAAVVHIVCVYPPSAVIVRSCRISWFLLSRYARAPSDGSRVPQEFMT